MSNQFKVSTKILISPSANSLVSQGSTKPGCYARIRTWCVQALNSNPDNGCLMKTAKAFGKVIGILTSLLLAIPTFGLSIYLLIDFTEEKARLEDSYKKQQNSSSGSSRQQKEIKNLNTKLRQVNLQNQQLSQKIAQQNKKINTLTAQTKSGNNKSSPQIQTLKNQVKGLNKQLQEANAMVTSSSQELANAKDTNTQLRKIIEEKQKNLKELDDTCKSLNTQKIEAEEKAKTHEIQVNESQNKIRELASKIEELQNQNNGNGNNNQLEIDSLKIELSKNQQLLVELQEISSQQLQRANELQIKLELAENEKEGLKKSIITIQNDNALHINNVNKLQNQINDQLNNISIITEKNRAYEEKLISLNTQLNEKQIQIETLIKSASGDAQTNLSQITQLQNQIALLEEEKKKTKLNHELAIVDLQIQMTELNNKTNEENTKLKEENDKLQKIFNQFKADSQTEITDLQSKNIEQENNLSSLRLQLKEKDEERQKDQLAANEKERELNMQIELLKQQVKSLTESASGQADSQLEQVKLLQERINKLEEEKTNAEAKAEQSARETDALNKKLANVIEEKDNQELEFNKTLKSEIEKTRQTFVEINNEIHNKNKELNQKNKQLQTELNEANESIETFKKEKESFVIELQKAKSEIQIMDKDLNDLGNRVDEYNTKYPKIIERLNNAASTIDWLKKKIQKMRNDNSLNQSFYSSPFGNYDMTTSIMVSSSNNSGKPNTQYEDLLNNILEDGDNNQSNDNDDNTIIIPMHSINQNQVPNPDTINNGPVNEKNESVENAAPPVFEVIQDLVDDVNKLSNFMPSIDDLKSAYNEKGIKNEEKIKDLRYNLTEANNLITTLLSKFNDSREIKPEIVLPAPPPPPLPPSGSGASGKILIPASKPAESNVNNQPDPKTNLMSALKNKLKTMKKAVSAFSNDELEAIQVENPSEEQSKIIKSLKNKLTYNRDYCKKLSNSDFNFIRDSRHFDKHLINTIRNNKAEDALSMKLAEIVAANNRPEDEDQSDNEDFDE